MIIIITMAGLGTRFTKQGLIDKFKITFDNKTLLEHSLNSLRQFWENHFIFVTRFLSEDDKKKIQTVCKKIGINSYEFFNLNKTTSGQAESAYLATLSIQEDTPFLIYNIDTKIKNLKIPENLINDYDGNIVTFNAEGEHWSFVKTLDCTLITKVVEKERISNLASVGLYIFNSLKLYQDFFERFHHEILNFYGETFVAPFYDKMIIEGKKISNYTVPSESVIPMGTPEELDAIFKNEE